MVCAAGAWSRSVGEMVGVPLPVTPVRRQILYTEPIANLPQHLPMTIDFSHRLLLSSRGQRPADGDGRSQRDSRLQARCHRRLDSGAAGGRRAARPGDHRGRHRRRMGGAVRGLARPQRDRRARRPRPHGSCMPPDSRATGSCRARRSARSCAISISGASRSWTSHRSRSTRFAGRDAAPREERRVTE